MALEDIKTRDEALQIAKAFIERGEKRAELVQWLHDEDMMGLECAQAVQLERLAAEDAAAGWKLAKWLIMEAAGERT